MKYATQLSCILQFCHCTFVTMLFRFFAGLIFNLPVCTNEHLSPNLHLGSVLVELTFGRMPRITRWSRADVISARLSSELPRWTPASETLSSRCTSTILSVSVVQRAERTLVSVLHPYFRRTGNCNYLLSNTVLLLSIDGTLLVLCQHPVNPCHSKPLLHVSILSFLASKFRNLSW